MRKNVAVESPGSWIVAVDDRVPPLAGRHVQRVAFPGRGLCPSILRNNGHVHAVKVHGVDHHSLVHETEPQLLSLLGDDRLGRGKTLSIEGVAVRAIIENKDVVDISLFDWQRILWLDDERAEQA